MGRLIVERGRARLRTADYLVTVDGVPAGTIERGGRREFDIPAGTHTLEVAAANRTATADVAFDMAEHETVRFRCNADGMSPAFWLTMLFGSGSSSAGQDSWLHLERVDATV